MEIKEAVSAKFKAKWMHEFEGFPDFAAPDEVKKALIDAASSSNPLLYQYTRGFVFNRSELEMIANLCKKHDVLCISDEVYEFMTYEGHEHIRMDLDLSDSGDGPRDYKIVRWMTRKLEDLTLDKAAEKLQKWKEVVQ